MKTSQKVLSMIALLAIFAIASTMDFEDAKVENQQYCEMVAIWNADAEKGIPKAERVGWPPYEGEEQCQKQ
jgi:hypothetical protein